MKKLIVVDTPPNGDVIKKVLEELGEQDQYFFDYMEYVEDMENSVWSFQKQPNGKYVGYHPRLKDAYLYPSEEFERLELNSLNIPDNDKRKTFLTRHCSFTYKNDYLLNEVDEIIFFGGDKEEIYYPYAMACIKYAEDHNLDISKIRSVRFTILSKECILDSFNHITEFSEIFNKVKEDLFEQKLQ